MELNYAEKCPPPEGHSYAPPYPTQNPPGYVPVPQGPPGPPGMPQQAGYPPPPQHPGPPYGQQPGAPYGQQPGVAYSQQYPNTVVVQQPTMVVGGPPPGPEPPSQMGCAIFVCLCCFCPTGILAILKAREAKNAWLSGDAVRAHSSASMARKFIIASVVIGILFTILSIVAQVLKSRLISDASDDDSGYDY